MKQVNEAAAVNAIIRNPKRPLFVPTVLLVLAILYVLSLIGIILDFPVIGHIDGLIVTAIAKLNLLQK